MPPLNISITFCPKAELLSVWSSAFLSYLSCPGLDARMALEFADAASDDE